MSPGSDISATLAELRTAAESRMTATCRVTRDGVKTEDDWDDETMQYVVPEVVAYRGICRVRRAGAQDHGATVADQTFIESQYVLHLPVVGSELVRKEDTVEVLTCPEDAGLVGRKFTVVAAPAYSQGTARRFPVREAQ